MTAGKVKLTNVLPMCCQCVANVLLMCGLAAGKVKLVREDNGDGNQKDKDLVGNVVWMKHEDLPVVLDTVL